MEYIEVRLIGGGFMLMLRTQKALPSEAWAREARNNYVMPGSYMTDPTGAVRDETVCSNPTHIT